MSKDKYPNIFSHQMEAIVFTIIIILQILQIVHEGKYLMDYKTEYPRDGLCCSRKYLHTPPTEGFFSLNPHPLWKLHFCAILSFKSWALKPPFPLEFLLTFLGVGMVVFWNYTTLCHFQPDTHSGVSVFKARLNSVHPCHTTSSVLFKTCPHPT